MTNEKLELLSEIFQTISLVFEKEDPKKKSDFLDMTGIWLAKIATEELQWDNFEKFCRKAFIGDHPSKNARFQILIGMLKLI